ncbi:hypothetical protein LTR40_014633, partial [Exophiala xenobiotica]
SVKDIGHVAWSVSETTFFRVLTPQDEFDQRRRINPMELSQHLKTTENPPAVTDIFQFLRSAIQPTVWQLPFTQPCSQSVNVNQIESANNGESTNTGVYLPSMRFGSGRDPKAAVKVRASLNVRYGFFNVDQVHHVEDRQTEESCEKETGVCFAPLISRECTGLRILKVCNIC